jgi:hypothetical protein
VQDALRPAAALAQLVDDAAADRAREAAAGASGAEDVAALVEDDAGVRKPAVAAVLKRVQRRLAPATALLGRQLENDAATAAHLTAARIVAAEVRRTIRITRRIENETAIWPAAIDAVGK